MVSEFAQVVGAVLGGGGE